jgi:hypothetical protein
MRKLSKGLVELIASLIIAFMVIMLFFSKEENFENLALGEFTKVYFAEADTFPIQTIGLRNIDKIVEGWKSRGSKEVVLMLGNSQSHSINQLKEGDQTFPGILSDSLRKKSIDIIASSVPNANLEEFYLLYKAWMERLPVKAVVVPVFLDDTRENGVHTVFFQDLVAFKISDTNAVAQRINKELGTIAATQNQDVQALHQTFQEKTENGLNEFLNEKFPPWHLRPTLRGSIFNNLYKLRNTVFGINAQSKRKIIKNRYDKNMQALNALLEDCNKRHVAVLLYIPPIRSDYEIPYIRSEYANFKDDITTISKKYHATFLNIEDVVPGEYWGYKGTRTLFGKNDLDFMHFQYPGHILVGKALQPKIEELIQ